MARQRTGARRLAREVPLLFQRRDLRVHDAVLLGTRTGLDGAARHEPAARAHRAGSDRSARPAPPRPDGRPASKPAPKFGSRIVALREAAGLSQAQVAAKLGIRQPSYAAWERESPALKPDRLAKLAEIFEISPEDFFSKELKPRRQSGPVGKLKQAFETAAELPPGKQKDILSIVEAVVAAHRLRQTKAGKAA